MTNITKNWSEIKMNATKESKMDMDQAKTLVAKWKRVSIASLVGFGFMVGLITLSESNKKTDTNQVIAEKTAQSAPKVEAAQKVEPRQIKSLYNDHKTDMLWRILMEDCKKEPHAKWVAAQKKLIAMYKTGGVEYVPSHDDYAPIFVVSRRIYENTFESYIERHNFAYAALKAETCVNLATVRSAPVIVVIDEDNNPIDTINLFSARKFNL